jgi:hypothetical protein
MFPLLQPNTMQTIARAVNVLIDGAFQAENDVIIMIAQQTGDGISEDHWPKRTVGFDGDCMHDHARRGSLPVLGIEVDLVPSGN